MLRLIELYRSFIVALNVLAVNQSIFKSHIISRDSAWPLFPLRVLDLIRLTELEIGIHLPIVEKDRLAVVNTFLIWDQLLLLLGIFPAKSFWINSVRVLAWILVMPASELFIIIKDLVNWGIGDLPWQNSLVEIRHTVWCAALHVGVVVGSDNLGILWISQINLIKTTDLALVIQSLR